MENCIDWFLYNPDFFEITIHLDETKLIALYGAILGTITFIWTLIINLKDKGKLKITAMIGILHPVIDTKTYLIVTATNIGRRPIQINGLHSFDKSAEKSRQGLFVITKNLPKKLNESDSVTEFIELDLLKKDITKIYFTDSHGMEWKLSSKVLIKLKKQYNTY